MPSICVQTLLSVTPLPLSKSIPAGNTGTTVHAISELQCTCADNVEKLEEVKMEGGAKVRELPMANPQGLRIGAEVQTRHVRALVELL